MIRSLLAILLVGGLSIYHADFDSESALYSVLLPLLALLSLIALALWIVTLLHRKGVQQTIKMEPGNGMDFPGGDGGD